MNDFVVSPNGLVCMHRYVQITCPRYERPTEGEFLELRQNGYAYKGAAECYSDSIYFFEFECGDDWHRVQARTLEEAFDKVHSLIAR